MAERLDVNTEKNNSRAGDGNGEHIGLGSALEMFAEVEEVLQILNTLERYFQSGQSASEKIYEHYVCILNQYQEQPHLLDPHLEKIINIVISTVRSSKTPVEVTHFAFKFLYIIIKVRGYKVVVRYLPHEIMHFEFVLRFLEMQDSSDTETWTTRYCLILWLSIMAKLPIQLSRLDDTDNVDKSVVVRIYDVLKKYTILGDKCSDAANYLAAQFLTRDDIRDMFLVDFFGWCREIFDDVNSLGYMRQGVLSAIATILKYAKRTDVLPHANNLLTWLINTNYKDSSGYGIRKVGFKIIQRIGLVFLRPHLASWRYDRGNRLLISNLSAGDANIPNPLTTPALDFAEDDDNMEVPIEVEDIIDELMQGLRSGDSVVRWTCAKGIGRVTGRLPLSLANDVLDNLLLMFSAREGHEAWHGACLTIAELGRRGLLLPSRLRDVIPLIIKALTYDELRGYASVGAHIRDSACYVFWAFGRAYAVEDLRPYMSDIGCALLIVAVFDREVNCRRAASAAFQENVGRQGTFPHGIDIMREADFFNVGTRSNAYLNVALYIAQFPEYRNKLINHLVDLKVGHWDIAIRELSAQTLHKLTSKNPIHMAKVVLPKLFEMTNGIDLNARHGSILAIGEIVHALNIAPTTEWKRPKLLNEEIISKIQGLITTYRQRGLFRGLGGELMKQACCSFIDKCSLAKITMNDCSFIDDWLFLLDECLCYEAENVRLAAVNALPSFFNEYYRNDALSPCFVNIVEKYLEKLEEKNRVTRMGYALALGSLPSFMLIPRLDDIISSLLSLLKINEHTLKWADCRRDALVALTKICETVTVELDIEPRHIRSIYSALLIGLNEYTQDNRGDIGAWVRQAAMSGLQSLTILLAKTNPILLDPDDISSMMAGIAQQAVEKIDRTRALAGKVFFSLVNNDPVIPHIPNHSELQVIFPALDCDLINWYSEAVTFPKFVRLLEFEDYTQNVMTGLIVSIGGLTQTLVKTSSASFLAYLDTLIDGKVTEVYRLCNVVLDIFKKYQQVDRIIIPLFSFMERVMSSGRIQVVLEDESSTFAAETLKLLKEEMANSRDLYKLIGGIAAICQYVQIPRSEGSIALSHLCQYLSNRHSYVRKTTASRLYEALLVYSDTTVIPTENYENISNILVETNWEGTPDEYRPSINTLYHLMGIPVPSRKPKVK